MGDVDLPSATYPSRTTGPGRPIRSPWSWFAEAPPKGGEDQWKSRHSAMELARSWCRDDAPSVPEECLVALGQTPLAGFKPWDTVPEWETPLDDAPGGTRNHDLLAVGRGDEGRIGVLAVEAKAGEKFGSGTLGRHLRLSAANPQSRVPYRIALLLEAITGTRLDLPAEESQIPPDLAGIGYQLFTAAVGAIIEAGRRNADCAVLVVHEFVAADWKPHRVKTREASHAQLRAFVAELRLRAGRPGQNPDELMPGGAVGPFRLHPTEFCPGSVDLYFCHVVTDLDKAGT